MESGHQRKPRDPSKRYPCEVCHQSFTRTYTLARHMRLHTGVKPFMCGECGQGFTRSDHLTSHQRASSGLKPYKCPKCSYSACRQDMVTRHLQTHLKKSSSSSSKLQTPTSSNFSTFDSLSVPYSMELEVQSSNLPIKMESFQPSRPPSSSSSLTPDSSIPLSLNLNLNTPSVNSPASPAHLNKE